MRPSHIIAVDAKHISEGVPSGYVLLGHHDGLAYLHVAPQTPVRRFVQERDGNLLDASTYRQLADGEQPPEGKPVLVTGDTATPPWGDDYTAIYDPAPKPFRWQDFEEAAPDLAAPRGEDKEGNPTPPILAPHSWAGE
jgi:hypothetical protein